MTPQEFAAKIRAKAQETNPDAYKDVDDVTLSQKFIEKFPVYKGKVSFSDPGKIAGLRSSAEVAKAKADAMSSKTGQAKETIKATGEIFGIQPTARRIAASIAPLTEKPEDMANVVEELVRGVDSKRKMDSAGEGLKKIGVNENIAEGVDIALDLPLISLGLSKAISGAIEKQAIKSAPQLAGLLDRPVTELMSEYAPDELKKILKTDVGDTVSDALSKADEVIQKSKDKVVGIKNNVVGRVEKIVAEPLQPQYETTLGRIKPETFDKYANSAKLASRDYKESTPLEIAGKEAQSALDTIQRKLRGLGEQKRAVLGKASVGNKPVGNIVVKFRQNLNKHLSKKTSVEGDNKLFRDVMSEAERLGDNPTAKDVDRFIDFVQDRIYTGGRDLTVPVTDDATRALRQMTGELNESLKSQLPDSYRGLNRQFADMIGVRDELNAKLGKEGEKGGSLMKRVFSPSDANTKKLFEDVKELTGIDLVDEATTARMMMELAGDSRQASLLQQLDMPPITPSGLTARAWDWMVQNFNTPKMKLKRARELLQEPK